MSSVDFRLTTSSRSWASFRPMTEAARLYAAENMREAQEIARRFGDLDEQDDYWVEPQHAMDVIESLQAAGLTYARLEV